VEFTPGASNTIELKLSSKNLNPGKISSKLKGKKLCGLQSLMPDARWRRRTHGKFGKWTIKFEKTYIFLKL
jgi:hypothetical protein